MIDCSGGNFLEVVISDEYLLNLMDAEALDDTILKYGPIGKQFFLQLFSPNKNAVSNNLYFASLG